MQTFRVIDIIQLGITSTRRCAVSVLIIGIGDGRVARLHFKQAVLGVIAKLCLAFLTIHRLRAG